MIVPLKLHMKCCYLFNKIEIRSINEYKQLKEAIESYLKKPSGNFRSGRGRSIENQPTKDLLVVLSKATGNSDNNNWPQQLNDAQRDELKSIIENGRGNHKTSQCN